MTSIQSLAAADRAPDEIISALYLAVLGRPADPEGRARWAAQLERGAPLLSVARDLANSPEALARPALERARTEAELRCWESALAVSELAVASWGLAGPYSSGTVAHEVFVRALFEVALHRRPSTAEVANEVARLVGGAGREQLLRDFAGRPEARRRYLGVAARGPRGRLRQLREGRRYLGAIRLLVAVAEDRQVGRLLDSAEAARFVGEDH